MDLFREQAVLVASSEVEEALEGAIPTRAAAGTLELELLEAEAGIIMLGLVELLVGIEAESDSTMSELEEVALAVPIESEPAALADPVKVPVAVALAVAVAVAPPDRMVVPPSNGPSVFPLEIEVATAIPLNGAGLYRSATVPPGPRCDLLNVVRNDLGVLRSRSRSDLTRRTVLHSGRT